MKIVMTQRICQQGLDLLKGKAEVYDADDGDPNHYLDQMADADGLIMRLAKCDAHVLENSPKLKVIGRTGVGFDTVDVKKATEMGIPVVITPGANNHSVAEHAVTLMLALSKNLVEADRETRKGNWNIRGNQKAFEFEGKTVGVVGMGNIGSQVAKLCNGLGMKVLGYDAFFSQQQVEQRGAEYCSGLDEMLDKVDFLTVHVPLLDSTRNLIASEQLKKMKPSAFVINTSRGGIVNETDLREALNNGIIAGAALDVFCEEPLKADNPLLQTPNLIVTPHSAAQTREAVVRMATMCVQGCLAVLSGEKWPYVADQKVYEHPKWK